MNWRAVFTVYLKELKETLRDRRAVMAMVLIPTIVMPGLIFGVGKIATKAFTKAREEIPAVMIVGGGDSPEIVAQLKERKKLRVVPFAADWKQRISDKVIRAAVELPAGFEAGLKSGVNVEVPVYHYEGEIRSGFAAGELEAYFRELREKTVAVRLGEKGLSPDTLKPFATKRQNVAAPEKVGGNLFGGIVPYIIILLCFTGAMYPALDLTAGEKERGTMETLLCSPVERSAIVLGKFLMVLTGSLSAITMSLLSMTGSAFVGGSLMMGGDKLAAGAGAAKAAAAGGGGAIPLIDPLGVLGVLALVLPVAVLFAAIIFTVALFAKSYKEAQSYVGPMIFIVIVPAMMAMFPGIELNAKLALVPILNVSLACKEMLSGVWHWPQLALIFASTAVYAGGALALAVAMFKRESVMFRS